MSLLWREHPVLTPPTPEEMAVMEPEELVKLHRLYHDAIENSIRDPYRYGFPLPHWTYADKVLQEFRTALLLGANRSGKTSYGAKTVVRAAVENPGSLILAWSQNDETSVTVQQPAVWEQLPEELRVKATGETHYISYSQQNGFAGHKLTFPNRSQILFKKYSQFQNNPTILEGLNLGSPDPKWINVGSWLDEYLQGMEMLDRLYLRLATRNAKLLITFTPKDGETDTVRNYREEAETIEERHAPLIDELHGMHGYKVPYLQKNYLKNTGIVYFHTKDNPWGGYNVVAETCRAKQDMAYTLTAAYGVPTKSATTRFPSFSREINVVKHEDLPWAKDASKGYPTTRYLVLDPAGRKKWFMVWIAVDASETWWVYREWPDVSVGDWAEWKNGKWAPGEGAKPDGQVEGVGQYVDMIRMLEKEDNATVFERLIDPRLGAAKYQSMTGVSSTIEDLADAGMVFEPAPGIEIEDGLQALKNKMAYDKKRPIDATNRPHFYISDRCENIIRALLEYTGDDGKDECWKDCVDVIRYAAVAEIRYIDPKLLKPHVGARGGY